MKLEDYKAWLLQHGEIKRSMSAPIILNVIRLNTKMAVTF